jgi:hypothetical protein
MAQETLEFLNRMTAGIMRGRPRPVTARIRRLANGNFVGSVSEPWADGWGRWHVQVENVGTVRAQAERARRAIAREVRARQGEQRVSIRLATAPAVTDTGRRTWSEAL